MGVLHDRLKEQHVGEANDIVEFRKRAVEVLDLMDIGEDKVAAIMTMMDQNTRYEVLHERHTAVSYACGCSYSGLDIDAYVQDIMDGKHLQPLDTWPGKEA